MQGSHEINHRRQGGFTLLEVAFGIGLLGLVAVSVMATIATCSSSQNYFREREEAQEAARAQLEEVIAWRDFNTLRTTFHGRMFNAGPLTSPDPDAVGPGTIRVTELQPDLLRISALVDWVSPASGVHRFELSTLVANRKATVLVDRSGTGGAGA